MLKQKEVDINNSKTTRIVSIDVIRGLTILLMIFVNDIGGVSGIPEFLKHMPTHSDGMTFVDLVFPSFLFIVGMSIPFSIGRRLDNKEENISIWKHILIRVFGLLLLGFFMVNGDHISDSVLISPRIWIILMYLSIIIIWNKSPHSSNLLKSNIMKYGAAALLIILAIIYRGGDLEGIFQMRPYWWGILGLIGWAYLVACIIFIIFKNNQFALLGSIVLLYLFYIADAGGMFSEINLFNIVSNPGFTFGTHSAIILTGALLGNRLKEGTKDNKYRIKSWSLVLSIYLLLAALFLHSLNSIHQMFIVSKNLGTVPWALLSSALTIWIWVLSYWLIDIKGIKKWSLLLKHAGRNPLFAYILAPLVIEILYLIFEITGISNVYYLLGQNMFTGILRSIILAFSMTWLAGYLSEKGIQLKL